MERTLYDINGYSVAYIADDGERSIYLWSGHAVAYIDDRLNCYGWNGLYLGWIEDGVLFDNQGHAVGNLRSKRPNRIRAEPVKQAKCAKPVKNAKYHSGPRPAQKMGTSSLALEDFLKTGAVGSV